MGILALSGLIVKRYGAVVLLVGAAWGQGSDQIHNGNYWRTLPHDMKIAYVIGYTDGECAGEMRVWTALPTSTQLQRDIAPSVFPKGIPYAEQCLFPKQTTYGQISDAIDQFYQTAKNRLILTDDAWGYVKAEIEGVPWSAAKLGEKRKIAAQ